MKKKIFSSLLMVVAMLAAVGTFVSCTDYDDDINANKDAITALQTQLQTLESALTQAKNDASDAHAQFATTQQVEDAAKEAAATAKAEAIAEAVEQCRQLLAGKADQSDLDALATRIASIEETLLTLPSNIATTDDVEAAKKNLQDQIDAINLLIGNLEGTNVAEKLQQLEELKSKLETAISTVSSLSGDVDAIKKAMEDANKSIDSVETNVNILQYLINKILTSIALLPDLYVDGIEAIEFKSIYYVPQVWRAGDLHDNGEAILIDNGETEATYRLNPSSVLRESIDEDNIEYKAAVAETRQGYVASPVAFNGISSYENGLMTVKLKKTITGSLTSTLSDGDIYIVSLKVPRKADKDKGVEAADIYSENSRLVENTFTPKIAALPWESHSVIDYKWHYSDSTSIYSTRIDADARVTKELYYKDKFDLNEIVTGCVVPGHDQITKDELKKYGITFRYYIAAKEYKNGADNETDQQTFAAVTPEGVISSKTPAGVTDNAAVVGKEPIVRVCMIDTVNGKLVDQRYLKIKWTNEEKPAVQLDSKTSEAVLNCDEMKVDITWVEFVNNVYAKANGLSGLSQSDFEAIYPFSQFLAEFVSYETNWGQDNAYYELGNNTSMVYAWSGMGPQFQNTTNDHGDAIIGSWSMTPEEIKKVYNSSQGDYKTIRYKVTLKSSIPTEYPDLWFYWDFKITLPTLPSINGFYDQYWLNNDHTTKVYDVLPVQYNTAADTRGYCVYDNNLMNAFTYAEENGVRTFIVKDIPNPCGTWDMQFSKSQPVSGYLPAYGSSVAEPDKRSIDYATFPAYQLNKSTSAAVRLNWDENHTSWCGNMAHKTANLFADHFNVANQALLNPLSDVDETTTLGLTVPQRTHDKKIAMSVWATLNKWNFIPVYNYNVCLIAPLRINAKVEGAFEDGHVSGTTVDFSKAFTMTDFRGYTVAETTTGTTEQTRYAADLYKYYEVQNIVLSTARDEVHYTMHEVNGSVVIDNDLDYASSLSAQQLYDMTNGNINLSITQSGMLVTFKNNGGSNIEKQCYAYIPVTVTYGFGTVKAYVKVPVYPASAN